MSSITKVCFHVYPANPPAHLRVTVEWRKHAFSDGTQGFVVLELLDGGCGGVGWINKKSTHDTEDKAVSSALRYYRKLKKQYGQ
jgi:hypothetical protein